MLITLFYVVFSICIVYPPTEFVSAGFTIAQLFDSYLGSENSNFILYHMRRITITILIHSSLPLGYVFALWFGGERGPWMFPLAAAAALLPLVFCYKLMLWWEKDKSKHPVVMCLLPYVTPGTDWRVIAASFNIEYKNVGKVSIPLTSTSWLVATETWIIMVGPYGLNLVKQMDCVLVATATDSHNLSETGEEDIQYLNIEVIPSRDEIEAFSFRISTTALKDLQPRLSRPVRVPEHILLLPTRVEKFIKIFKMYVQQNPIYYTDHEMDQCLGCMSNQADVKLTRRCLRPPLALQAGTAECQQCNCRALWCCLCMARWWASRARCPPEHWLGGRGTCPVCRAPFCLLDVCPARQGPAPPAPAPPTPPTPPLA